MCSVVLASALALSALLSSFGVSLHSRVPQMSLSLNFHPFRTRLAGSSLNWCERSKPINTSSICPINQLSTRQALARECPMQTVTGPSILPECQALVSSQRHPNNHSNTIFLSSLYLSTILNALNRLILPGLRERCSLVQTVWFQHSFLFLS